MRHHHHHPSRLVTLGANLAILVETGSLAAMTLGSLTRAVIGAPFRESRRLPMRVRLRTRPSSPSLLLRAAGLPLRRLLRWRARHPLRREFRAGWPGGSWKAAAVGTGRGRGPARAA